MVPVALMWRKLGIEPGEERVFARGVVVLFLVGWATVFLGNLAVTLFNKRVGSDQIANAFVLSAFVLFGTTAVFGWIASRSDRLLVLPIAMAGLGAALLPLYFLLPVAETSVPWILIVASKQIDSIPLLVFWIAMGDIVHGRQAKRLFGPMVAGMTLGMTLGSAASIEVGRLLGVESLILVAAGTLWLGAAAAVPLRGLRPRLGARSARTLAAEPPDGSGGPSIASIWRESPLLRLVVLIALGAGLVGPMLYVQFLHVADASTTGEQGLLSFIAKVQSALGGVTLLAQVFLVSWLYRRIGIPLSIALAPLAYLSSFVGLSVSLVATVGSAARIGTKLTDDAVYDPALRVIYNLFPESMRARAAALAEGPVKRLGTVLGNLLCSVILLFGSVAWIGYVALPIVAVWLVAALALWRQYPRLLLEASARRARLGEAIDEPLLLDGATIRALLPELSSGDRERSRVALDLVAEAPPDTAVPVLAEALEESPEAGRSAIVAALDRLLETAVTKPVSSNTAARRLEAVLASADGFPERDQADLVQSYGRLRTGQEAVPLLRKALEEGPPAVRLAALAALHDRDDPDPRVADLDAALEHALAREGQAARRTAREELRSRLLCGEVDRVWERRLSALAALLEDPAQRAQAAEALAEVSVRCGDRMRVLARDMLEHRADPELRLRAALLRFCGHAGLEEQTGWLVDHLGSAHPEWDAAAREALSVLGPMDTLLRELSYGGRSRRDGILEVMRSLHTEPETLRALYEREVDSIERDLLHVFALRERPVFTMLRQRLEERVYEKLHTALLFLAAIRGEDRIAELGERLRDPSSEGRRYAIVLEALEATLHAEEKTRLIPILEDGELLGKAANLARVRPAPSFDESLNELLKDPDDLTRRIATGLALAAGFEVEEDEGVDVVDKMLHLKTLPIFEGLSARQLMNLAGSVREASMPAGEVVVAQGDCDDRLFLVVEGVIHILRGETLLAEMGPGDFFGEIALFEGTARTATAVAQSRVRLLALERADLLSLIEEMPGIAVVLLQTLSRRVRDLTDRLMV